MRYLPIAVVVSSLFLSFSLFLPLTLCVPQYRRHAGNRCQFETEQFIELFDADLVTLPQTLPAWFLAQRQLMDEEEELFHQIVAKKIMRVSDLGQSLHPLAALNLSVPVLTPIAREVGGKALTKG
eukprot:TRINITY_DN7344_c0_g1_i1.p2 TRINITY_DN7344_c0_g1~~TRINITY_DN7344_c0_g1_i1.p2  ORF type:complete len:125 (+),score=15.86 TRINITY_DN7344_c0_g1_i1:420-794(+)